MDGKLKTDLQVSLEAIDLEEATVEAEPMQEINWEIGKISMLIKFFFDFLRLSIQDKKKVCLQFT